MKVRITSKGIYGAEGEAPIGLEVEVPHVPKSWVGRCVVVDEAKPKTIVVNPASDDKEELLAQAEDLGIEVDKRWGAKRLQEEIDAKLGE